MYLNWLLTKKGQVPFVQSAGYVSSRLDVPTDHTFPWRVPLPGAVKTYTLEALDTRHTVVSLLEEIFGR